MRKFIFEIQLGKLSFYLIFFQVKSHFFHFINWTTNQIENSKLKMLIVFKRFNIYDVQKTQEKTTFNSPHTIDMIFILRILPHALFKTPKKLNEERIRKPWDFFMFLIWVDEFLLVSKWKCLCLIFPKFPRPSTEHPSSPQQMRTVSFNSHFFLSSFPPSFSHCMGKKRRKKILKNFLTAAAAAKIASIQSSNFLFHSRRRRSPCASRALFATLQISLWHSLLCLPSLN